MKYRVRDTRSGLTFTVRDRCWWLRPLAGVGAITISGSTVWVKRALGEALRRNPALLDHEATHIRQARAYGWRYLPRYVRLAIATGFQKRRHPMEVVAYVNEPQYDVEIL